MTAVDSSVVVAGFGSWHERHEAAVAELRRRPALPAHAALEAYSVLTRLPEPFRAGPSTVAEYLRAAFPGRRLTLAARRMTALPGRLAEHGIAGGAVYDGLIAVTAQDADEELATLDRRALGTYERLGASARLLA